MKQRISIRQDTLESAFADFLQEKKAAGLSASTLKAYRSHFDAVGAYIDPETCIELVTSRVMRRVIAEMADSDLSRNSIRSYTATLSTFFNWCRREDICDVKIDLFKGEESVPELYTADELKRLLKRPNPKNCTFSDLRSWAIINLLVSDGCRAGTIRAIQIRDVHLEDHVIYMRHSKTRRITAIPLSGEMVSVLSEYMRHREGKDDDFLFCTETGTQMSHDCLKNSLNRYNKKHGVNRTGIHKYRHTFARLYLVDCGGDALKLQRLLGHSTLDMTRHYLRIFDDDIIADYQKRSPLDVLNAKKPRGTKPRSR